MRFSSTRRSGRTSSTSHDGGHDDEDRRRPTKQRVRPAVQHMLDAITGAPARARAERPLGHPRHERARACPLLEMYVDPVRPVNHARFVFLDPRAQDFYRD